MTIALGIPDDPRFPHGPRRFFLGSYEAALTPEGKLRISFPHPVACIEFTLQDAIAFGNVVLTGINHLQASNPPPVTPQIPGLTDVTGIPGIPDVPGIPSIPDFPANPSPNFPHHRFNLGPDNNGLMPPGGPFAG